MKICLKGSRVISRAKMLAWWCLWQVCLPAFAQDQNWDDRFGLQNFSATVSALSFDNSGHLYAGGQFSGNPGFNHVALWDGRHWSGLGSGPNNGTTNSVNALLVQGTNVFVGGNFAGFTNETVGFVASWDGSNWTSLGSGVSSNVYAFAGDGTNLYVGGSFNQAGGNPAMNVAQWNGNTWLPLGAGLGVSNARVNCLVVGPDGFLYAGGSFTNSGGLSINHVARWDGTNWSPLGPGVNNQVQAIAFNGTNLCIGGAFNLSGANNLYGIGQWDGAEWLNFAGGVSGGSVFALASDGTNLYAGGSFTRAGGVLVSGITRWNGTNWTGLSTGMNGTVNALVWNQGSLYASGGFTSAGAISASHVAMWDGQQWSALSFALDGGNPTRIFAVANQGTNVYVAGSFSSAGGVPANNIAWWNGRRWSAMGKGSTNGIIGNVGTVYSIVVSASGQVYAGGIFTNVGGISISDIARWDGTNWFPLGSGVNTPYFQYGSVKSLAVAPNGDLYAAGEFSSIGGVNVNSLARWDGTNWYDVGGGVSTSSAAGIINSLLCRGTNLYGVDIMALATDGTNLYAAGQFPQIGGVNATNLAQWDGTNWNAYPPVPSAKTVISSLAIFKNEIIVGGNFTNIDGLTTTSLARWIDNQWWPLGSGLAGGYPVVNNLSVSPAGLLVGGNFTQAGSQNANCLALWDLTNELPAIQITSPSNGAVFNGYQTIPISANSASANGPITQLELFVDGSSLGTFTNPPIAGSWSNLTSGSHVISATASDVTGASWTENVSITVNLPTNGPIITQQPQSETLSNGATFLISVQATGNGTVDYQWFKDGVSVAGATNSSVIVTNAQLGDSAVYTVAVSDGLGTNTSIRAPVSILQPVSIVWVNYSGFDGSPAIGRDGTIYIAADSDLFAYEPNGAFKWFFQNTNNYYKSPAVDANNDIYDGSQEMDSVNPNGTLHWTFATGSSAAEPSPAFGVDGTIYLSTGDSNLCALNPAGVQKWSFPAPAEIDAPPVIGPDGAIYLVTASPKLYALATGGSNLWTFTANASFGNNSPAIGGDGTIYVAAGTNLLAINPSGSLKWQFHGAGPFYASPVIGADGTIYIGNDGILDTNIGAFRARFYAITPQGSEKWEFDPAINKIRSIPAVSADGAIYFGSENSAFYALNADGTERWALNTDGAVESAPAILSDGVVYFSGGGSLFAVTGSAPLAASPWPMYQHDPQHSGNAATASAPGLWFKPFAVNGFDDQVNAVATAGNDVYVGGNFRVAGGVSANYVARWDGTNWFPLGAGLNGQVNAIAINGTNVFVGGAFTAAGGMPASFVACWDGSQWHSLGGGVSDLVDALAATETNLYVGGYFSTAGGVPAYGVASWDGNQWSALGAGPGSYVSGLAVSGNDVYANTSDPFGVQHWNGTQWSLLGQPNEPPQSIAANASGVYVGGGFSSINGVAANGIARWDGSQWLPLGDGIGAPSLSSVNAIALENTNIYIGGPFTLAGGTAANSIARWDGTQWHAMGGGITGATLTSAVTVNSIGIANGRVYAGGAFFAAGGDPSIKYFAGWNGTNWYSLNSAPNFANGQFRLLLSDPLGRAYGIEASSDLFNWTRVTTFTNLGGYSEFVDNPGTNDSPHRYFRAVIP